MEPSASAPALGAKAPYSEFDYQVVRTGIVPRVLQGQFSKDKGTFSSRIAQIIRQAEKYPGPGKYLAHVDYGEEKNQPADVHAFPKMERTYKPCNKNPSPGTYEDKDFVNNKINAAKPTLSQNPRVTQGKIATGKKRSFTDQAVRHGASCPGPGYLDVPKDVYTHKLDVHRAAPSLTLRTKEKSRNAAPPDIGPGHYSPSYSFVEENLGCHYSVPKGRKKNFIDKAVAAAALDARTGAPSPGPGHHNMMDVSLYKVSRGTMKLQMMGMSRGAASGYM